MSQRREVRVSDSFFADLDDQLGAERGTNGEPSATDFIVVDLPAIVERFATAFDDLPEAVVGVGSARMLLGTAALVRAFVVHGVKTAGQVVHLVGVEIDL